jgi:hypothetical protein
LMAGEVCGHHTWSLSSAMRLFRTVPNQIYQERVTFW